MITKYWGNKVLNMLCATANPDIPNGTWAGLHSSDPGEVGNPATEIAGGSYGRINVSFTSASGLSVVNKNSLKWSNLPYAVLTHVAIWSHSDGGRIIMYTSLGSQTVVTGQTFTIDKYWLSFSL